LTYESGKLIQLHTIWIKFKGQSRSSMFTVTEKKCCWSGRCDLKWRLSNITEFSEYMPDRQTYDKTDS